MATTSSQASVVTPSKLRCLALVSALLINRSMRPRVATKCCATALTACLSATSSSTASALPRACKLASALALVAAVQPEMSTWAPALTSWIAPAKPMPLPPPVTQATCPLRCVCMANSKADQADIMGHRPALSVCAHLLLARPPAGRIQTDKTDRKFKPQATSPLFALHPLSSSTTLCSPPPTINFKPKTALVWCSQRFDARKKWLMHTASMRIWHTTPRTTPAPDPHQSALRRFCHLYSAGLPPQCLVKLQFWYRLCTDTHIVQQPIMPSFRSQVCRLVKLKFRDCLNHRFRSIQLLPNLHIQRR